MQATAAISGRAITVWTLAALTAFTTFRALAAFGTLAAWGTRFAFTAFDRLCATAALMSDLNAASFSAPPSAKSIARRVPASRLALNRPSGSASDAPCAKVSFTYAL